LEDRRRFHDCVLDFGRYDHGDVISIATNQHSTPHRTPSHLRHPDEGIISGRARKDLGKEYFCRDLREAAEKISQKLRFDALNRLQYSSELGIFGA
jgi:hypothetical protein